VTTSLAPVVVPGAPPASAVRVGQKVQRALQRVVWRMAPPPMSLMSVVADRWRADALGALTRLRVPDALAAGARPVDDVARELGLNPDALYRVLRALARDGFFSERGRAFGLTPLTEPLRADHPHSMRNMVMELAAPRNAVAWSHLETALRTGHEVWSQDHDVDMWRWLDAHPTEHAVFHGAMNELTREGAPAFARAWDFGATDSVADVGGGTGLLLATILALHPKLRGALVDSPSVVAGAPPVLARYGVEDRVTVVGADIFEQVPPGLGAYVAKNIAHGLSDDRLVEVLRRWRSACRPDSRLVLVEVVVPEGDEPYLGFLDLQMLLVSFGGRERTAQEFAAVLASGGFVLDRIVATATPMSLVVAKPA
jgi:hypothetical protein